MVCDEADQAIDDNPYGFRVVSGQTTLFGLASQFPCKRAYFLSATFDPYHTAWLKCCFGLKSNIEYVWSQFEVTVNQKRLPYNSQSFCRDNDAEVDALAIKAIVKRSVD